MSFSSVFSSDRVDPEGQVVFYAASDGRGDLAPTSSTTNPTTGDTTVEFINVRDLSPHETYTFTLVVDMSGDNTWEAMDDLIHNLTATVNTMPDGSGSDVSATDSDTSDVMPIALVQKRAMQSTGVEQATGTVDRVYSYEIEAQNNYSNATDNVVVVDTLPDGIEFLGITSGHVCNDTRSNTTGITTVTCNLGSMAAGAQELITMDTGIRYDYFGTDNGGTNRMHNDFGGAPATGTPVLDKTLLTNHVDLDADYQGSAITTQSDNASVTAAYATVNKSGHISEGGNGDTINYTISYSTSEYYDILDGNVDDNTSSITLHDHLPDGQTYVTVPAPSPTPSSVVVNGDGTTDIYWNSSVLNGQAHSGSFNVTFSATTDSTWNNGEPIVAGDYMNNDVTSHGEWDDQVDNARANSTTDSNDGMHFETEVPGISKQVEDPNNPGTWLDATDAVVGDTLKFRVRFNTTDGVNPEISNVNLGDTVVTDWLPIGMSYNNDAVETFSAAGDFTDGGDPDTASAVTIGSLNGVEWNLGDVAQGGWWQAIFTASVDDVTAITDGAEVNNIWKMTGVNSFDSAYSDRDMVAVTYHEPKLVLGKSVTNALNPLKPGDNVEYTVTITNNGGATAKDILFKDTVAEYMDDASPTITSISLNGANLVVGNDYLAPTFNNITREFAIDFNDGAIETNIPAGETLTIVYQTTVDNDAGVGRNFINTATVAYDTQDDGSGRTVAGTSNVADDNTDNVSTGMPNMTANKTVSAGPYAIGDIITYTIDVTLPQGEIAYWPKIEDTFNMDGVAYVPGTSVLSNVSGTPVTGASFDGGADPTITTANPNETKLSWDLSNPIDNRGQATDYVFRLTFNVQYTGLEDNGTDWEFFVPTNGDQVDNSAIVSWVDYPAGARTTNHNANAPIVQADIDQPLLSTVKTVTSVGPYTSGSTISYQSVITNTGQATAYDITWEDNISSFTNNATLTSISHSVNGALVSGTDFQENFAGSPLTIDFDGGTSDTNLAPGETLTIAYSVVASGGVGAGATITNTADADWSSMDGVVAGERTYNDAAPESAYTADTNSANITIASPIIVKSIASPASGIAEIGEVVNYQLRITVPSETVLYGPIIQDVLTADGLEYVNGSVNVTTVSGNPEVAATITAAPVINTTSPDPGTTIDFVFDNDIDNANPGVQGDTDYVFDVTYQMVVTGEDDAGNWIGNPGSASNTATINWSDGSTNRSANDNETLSIVRPHLTLVKNFDVENVVGGDMVTATVVITNDGNGTAYELDSGADFIDTMPEGFINPQLISLTHSTNGLLAGPADYTFTASGNDFTIEYNSAQTNLAPGETLTIVYTTDIDALIGAGANISNGADVDYSSRDGAQANERVFDDTNVAEDTADEDSDNVITANATITKTTTLGTGEATIGQEFDFELNVDIPLNTTVYNAEVADTIPDGFTVTGTSTTPAIGTVTVGAEVNGVTPVTWDVGDVSNLPVDELELIISVRVDDAYFDASLLDGLPVVIDGDAQDNINNMGTFNWDDANVGGNAHTDNDDEDVTIVEPHPTITKTVNSNVAGIGDTMHYSVVIANDGTSTLYNINWDDTLPGDLFDAGTSPTLTSVTHSANGVLAEGTNYNSSFGTNPMTINFNVVPETSLAPGESLTILYDAIVENTVSIGDVLTNNARITFSASQPNSNPNRRSYYGNDQTSVTIASTSIGNFVWHDSNKNGIQDGGELGIENVSVHLLDGGGNPIDNPLNPGTPYVVQTDVNGEYLFTRLTAGNYQVHFDTPTGYTFSQQDQGGDDTLDSDPSTATGTTSTFALLHDEHISHIDAGLITANIGNSIWTDTNGNGIQDAGENGTANVDVHLLDGSGNLVDNPLNPGTPYIVQTNASGEYIFENLPAGDYQIQVDAPVGMNFSPQDQGGNDTLDSDAGSTGRTATITLVAGEDNVTTDIGMYQPVIIGNRVWQDDNVDGIQDAGENGLENIIVKLLDASGNPVDDPNNPGHVYEITTDGNGDYLFENLLPGDYQLEFVSPAGYHISPQDQGGDDAVDSDADRTTGKTDVVTFVSGDSNTTLDTGMYRLSSIAGKTWRDDERDGIQADWEPVLEGVVVELLNGLGNPVDEPGNPGTPYTITTGANGEYLFENLEPGDYQVRFTPPADHNPADKDAGGDDTKDSDINIGTLTTDTITVISGENNTSTDAGFYALYANVFDPPSAIKTVGETGENEIEWKMVWINDGNMVALEVQILDDIPAGTTYVPGSFACDARGNSVTNVCTYDGAENRVRWEGNMDFDIGGTSEDDSLHEVVLTYRTTVPTSMETVENQASAYWDANGNGSFTDDIIGGQTPTVSDSNTMGGNNPTTWNRRKGAEGKGFIGNTIWLDSNNNGKQDEGEEGLEDIRVKLIWYGLNGKYDHGEGDDYVWRTDTNHNGHYEFKNLPKGKFKVIVKEEDVAKYVQTYDPDNKMDSRDNVKLKNKQNYTKADFGYNTQERKLAKTGSNAPLMIGFLMLVLVMGVVYREKKIAGKYSSRA